MSGLVYEVNVAVDAAVADTYRAWLAVHVAEIVALPGFTGAELWRVVDPPPPAHEVHWCVQYRLRDTVSLERYLREHAPRLRAEGIARFGAAMRAQRRVLHAD